VRRAQLTETASGPERTSRAESEPAARARSVIKDRPRDIDSKPANSQLAAHGRQGNSRRVGPITPTGNTTTDTDRATPDPASDQCARAPAHNITYALPWFLTTRSKPQGESGWSGKPKRQRRKRERDANSHQQRERRRTDAQRSRRKSWQPDPTRMPVHLPGRNVMLRTSVSPDSRRESRRRHTLRR